MTAEAQAAARSCLRLAHRDLMLGVMGEVTPLVLGSGGRCPPYQCLDLLPPVVELRLREGDGPAVEVGEDDPGPPGWPARDLANGEHDGNGQQQRYSEPSPGSRDTAPTVVGEAVKQRHEPGIATSQLGLDPGQNPRIVRRPGHAAPSAPPALGTGPDLPGRAERAARCARPLMSDALGPGRPPWRLR